MEERYLANRGAADRVADTFAAFSGSMTFVLLHIFIYSAWILINLRLIPLIPAFDPYPFMLLSMVVSLEAIFLSAFVLMKQNRMSKRADSRAHLDLQINLLAEKEMTMVLQMLQHIGARVGVRDRRLERELGRPDGRHSFGNARGRDKGKAVQGILKTRKCSNNGNDSPQI